MEETSRSSTAGRVPPQDIEAEQSLLGSILLSDTVFPEIITAIKAEDFYEQRHQQIFAAMSSLYDHNKPIDLITLTAELKRKKTLRGVGGAPYLTELTNLIPTASHAKAYADIVQRTALRRKLIAAGTAIARQAYEDDADVTELVGQAEKELFDVSDDHSQADYSSMEDLAVEAAERLEHLSENKGALRGLKTGFRDLDNKTAGFQKGDLIILGARPSMGKTTFAQNLSYNIATINQAGVLFFSLEMSKDQIFDRMLSDVANVKSWNIRTGNLSGDEFAKIGDALGELGEAPIYIDDTSGLTVFELRNKARRAAHDHDIGIIIVDYLQLIRGSDRYAGNKVQEVTEISNGLKTLARELKVPVIALSQLSRDVTGRENPRPILSDLRDSGSIEQDADLVMFLHAPDYYHRNDDNYEKTNITELLIAKHRNGPIGKVELYFHEEFNRFMSLDKQHDE